MTKLIRPRPTKELIIEISGNNQDFISCIHHGLAECPSLSEFYPYLNLDELVAFAASSWRSRQRGELDGVELSGKDIYSVFSKEFNLGFPWLRKYKKISAKNTERYNALNPHEPRTFMGRIVRANPGLVDKLFEELAKPVVGWIFECQYEKIKRARGGDNYNLRIMDFQTVYPRKGKIVPNFAAEIARIISSYPREYEKYEAENGRNSNTESAVTQLSLFSR